MSKLKIGWAEESLVPPRKVNLAGQFIDRISQYVEDEITATAMAVEAGGDVMILVSCDVVKVSTAAMPAGICCASRFRKGTLIRIILSL